MVNVKDMYYACTNDEGIKQKAECGGAVTSLLRLALETGMADAVLAITKGADLYDGKPVLITDPNEVVKTAGSLHTAPINLGRFLSKYLDGARNMKIALPVKPCDARTIVALANRGKINLDNVIMIGLNCGGTIRPMEGREMIEKYYAVNPDNVVKEEIARGKFIIITDDHKHLEVSIDELEEHGSGRRANCQRCENKIPRMADLACGNWGVIGPLAGKATFVEVCSEKGAKLLDAAIKAGSISVSAPEAKGLEMREKINQSMLKLAAKNQKEQFTKADSDMEYWVKQFSKCIKCMGCTVHCPLAYDSKYKKPSFDQKGSIPPALTYHLSKVAAAGSDCINCGACEDVCPMDIPISKLYHNVAKRLEVQ